MKEVLLVPRRDDNGPRDALWDGFCKPWWEREQSHMPIIEGYHTDGLFNRSAAVNRAADMAGDWDVAVLIDADVVCNPERVKEAILLAQETGSMVLPHDVRKDLSPQGTQRVVTGFDGNWDRYVSRWYGVANGHPSVSSVVVIPRRLWDEVGGFDEAFRGWGFEDTAFAAACETFGGIVRLPGEVWHLWHPTAREGKRGTETHARNSALGQRYRAAIGNRELIRAIQNESRPKPVVTGAIPRILHRVVPEIPNVQADAWWARFEELHPDWELRTWRDPIDPSPFPMTSPYWHLVTHGAQLADLVRLEALFNEGGVYVDADVEPLRPFDSLLGVPMFAAWEDKDRVPNAVMGAVPRHPAIRACIDLAVQNLLAGGNDIASLTGPGVLTAILPGRKDVLLLPPGSLYPYHYREKGRSGEDFGNTQPWAFVVHHWWHSWKAT